MNYCTQIKARVTPFLAEAKTCFCNCYRDMFKVRGTADRAVLFSFVFGHVLIAALLSLLMAAIGLVVSIFSVRKYLFKLD